MRLNRIRTQVAPLRIFANLCKQETFDRSQQSDTLKSTRRSMASLEGGSVKSQRLPIAPVVVFRDGIADERQPHPVHPASKMLICPP